MFRCPYLQPDCLGIRVAGGRTRHRMLTLTRSCGCRAVGRRVARGWLIAENLGSLRLFGVLGPGHESPLVGAAPASGSPTSSALRATATRLAPSPRFIKRTPLVCRPALRTSF